MKVEIENLRSVAEYATDCGVTTMSVYRWIKKGKVAFKIIGGIKFIVVK
jgi:predicted site-specific integrase-resolvase